MKQMSMTATDDRDALEAALIRAQIDKIESEQKNRLFREMIPAISAVLIVVCGLIAGSIFISNYWETEVSAAREDLNALALVRSEVENSIATLEAKAQNSEKTPGNVTGNSNLAVNFHSCDDLVCSFSVESTLRNVEFDVFSDCAGSFIIPGSHPDFATANCVNHHQERMCSAHDARTICRFGPFAINEQNSGWWLQAVADSNVIVRYINFVAQ